MHRDEAIELIARKFKLVRIESGYTQDKMAYVLGLSKKTLVQIEKERILPSWTSVVAACSLFRSSEILYTTLGGDPLEVIETLAHDHVERPKDKTLGGKVWWKELEKKGEFLLQQNIISQHYRILDREGYRLFSTFDRGEATEKFEHLMTSTNKK
ncbi:transcriptional regulator [Bacillus sp. 165]|uniref:helix-turn-helix transcriptional regulator n=1 Tax=Bacillus sp. 165 TaxID=1529117 RepID=UPI001ADB2DDB|nr:transcriptional regulator [Bacillus sp. 165]MBO9129335.1 transcriptional regulator [Bacillus sp. 165]